jgi:glycerol-3-phosphate dehydrogenase (NAD(P)+)
VFKSLFEKTEIYLDFTTDVHGIEILSILKNIYAIVVGIVDAHFNSPNLRFLILTKAFDEMHKILLLMKGEEKTLFRYCGYGDFSLTALNDLSRNRTLGLLIGKGFFIDDISDKVVLEGKIAVNVFMEKLNHLSNKSEEFPILHELYDVFNNGYNISNFVNHLLAKIDSKIN